ncbi:5936_t:CDS:2, partial [Acaulospora morrowiae]
MEDIVQYQSDTSDNESAGELTEFPNENIPRIQTEDVSDVNLAERKKEQQIQIDGTRLDTIGVSTSCGPSERVFRTPIFMFDNISHSNKRGNSDKVNKKVKGYISKRVKLQQANETNLEIQQMNQLFPVQSVLPSDTKLLDLPNRIESALNESKDETQSGIIPKKCIIFLQKEHTKGVNTLLWCGSFGQVLASASMDGTVGIWDVFRSKKCVRIINHDGAVKDIRWDNFRNSILSGGYDKVVKLTDIETGITVQ